MPSFLENRDYIFIERVPKQKGLIELTAQVRAITKFSGKLTSEIGRKQFAVLQECLVKIDDIWLHPDTEIYPEAKKTITEARDAGGIMGAINATGFALAGVLAVETPVTVMAANALGIVLATVGAPIAISALNFGLLAKVLDNEKRILNRKISFKPKDLPIGDAKSVDITPPPKMVKDFTPAEKDFRCAILELMAIYTKQTNDSVESVREWLREVLDHGSDKYVIQRLNLCLDVSREAKRADEVKSSSSLSLI